MLKPFYQDIISCILLTAISQNCVSESQYEINLTTYRNLTGLASNNWSGWLLYATSGLPVLAHYWTDDQKCTGPYQTASTGPVEIFILTSYGPDGKCSLGRVVAQNRSGCMSAFLKTTQKCLCLYSSYYKTYYSYFLSSNVPKGLSETVCSDYSGPNHIMGRTEWSPFIITQYMYLRYYNKRQTIVSGIWRHIKWVQFQVAQAPSKLAHLIMLFILELACTACTSGRSKNK